MLLAVLPVAFIDISAGVLAGALAVHLAVLPVAFIDISGGVLAGALAVHLTLCVALSLVDVFGLRGVSPRCPEQPQPPVGGVPRALLDIVHRLQVELQLADVVLHPEVHEEVAVAEARLGEAVVPPRHLVSVVLLEVQQAHNQVCARAEHHGRPGHVLDPGEAVLRVRAGLVEEPHRRLDVPGFHGGVARLAHRHGNLPEGPGGAYGTTVQRKKARLRILRMQVSVCRCLCVCVPVCICVCVSVCARAFVFITMCKFLPSFVLCSHPFGRTKVCRWARMRSSGWTRDL